jgi:hypothetical protein
MRTLRAVVHRRLAAACAAVLIFGTGEMAAFGQNPHPMSDSARRNAHREIQALTADKSQWSKSQRKLDTQLIYAARMKSAGRIHPTAPMLRPGVNAEADGRFKVEIKGAVSPALLAAIQNAGGQVLSSFPNHHLIYALLPVENAESVAARDDVLSIRPAPKPKANAVDSQGDYTHQAIEARADYGVTGAGITVGVLSSSIDNGSGALANAIASGNVDPTNSFVLPGQAGTGDGEGLAMAEVVHDLAPGAKIWFATGTSSEAQFASNIIALASNGCNIICDDIVNPYESPFQDGVVAQAVQTVTSNGVLYFSSAGNNGNAASGTSSTWVGDFVSSVTNTDYGAELEFAPGLTENEILIPAYQTPYVVVAGLFWSDPLGASTNDYDLFMVNGDGHAIYASVNWQNGAQDPLEVFDSSSYEAGDFFVVTLYSGASRYLHLEYGNGTLASSYNQSIRGHNGCDARNSFSVAATPAYTASGPGNPAGPYPDPFNENDVVEYFSSDGAVRMFYRSDGTPYTPGNYSMTGGAVFARPSFTAADGVSTTLPSGSLNPFFGTSCATPHAAAIAALVWSYNRALTADQVSSVLTNSCVMIMTNVTITNGNWNDTAGFGILMAETALANTPPPPPSIILSGDTVALAWPTNAIGFTLQTTSALGPSAVWTPVPTDPVVVARQNTVPITISKAQQFFRLSN